MTPQERQAVLRKMDLAAQLSERLLKQLLPTNPNSTGSHPPQQPAKQDGLPEKKTASPGSGPSASAQPGRLRCFLCRCRIKYLQWTMRLKIWGTRKVMTWAFRRWLKASSRE